MKTRLTILIWLAVLSVQTWAQNKISHYEYWTDDQSDSRLTTPADDSGAASFSIDLSMQKGGLHTLVMRAVDADGKASPPVSKLYLAGLPQLTDNSIVAAEYWLDGESRRQRVSPSGNALLFDVDAANLSSMLHRLNFRVVDASGKWSPTSTHYFLPTRRPTTGNSIIGAEYWVDGSMERQQVAAQNGLMTFQLDGNTLTGRLHKLNYRVQDASHLWSSTYTRFFTNDRHGADTALIAGYAYRCNEGAVHTVELTPVRVLDLDATTLDLTGQVVPDSIPSSYRFDAATMQVHLTGEVRLSLQVYDTHGHYSATVTDTIAGLPLTLVLDATALQPDVAETAPAPIGGQITSYDYDCAPGDSIHISVEGTSHVDLFDANGQPVNYREVEPAEAPAKAWRSPDASLPTRTLGFTAASSKVYALLYGSLQAVEQTTVTLSVVVPSGIDTPQQITDDTLPPYIYTPSGVCISTRGRTLNQLEPGIYIVKGKKVVVRPGLSR
ncbi:MAG: hypothetical protein I3J02_02680 [Prevotella sp.]|nr:hypothetical protein [Prevotella sp.]